MQAPVIILSAGRSGSSVFHDLLTRHPDTCWLPRGCERHPRRLDRFRWAFLLVDIPGVGEFVRRAYQPTEGYGFWDHHYPGFSEPCRDLTSTDVTARARRSVPASLERLVTARRPRLVLKLTGWPRVGFLKELLPDAVFIHMVRDGRSVAESLLRMTWWRGWGGPENWRMGPLSAQEQELWESHDRSFVALAGIEWCKVVRAMENARSLVSPDKWHTVRYEDLCREPEVTVKEVAGFCGFRPSARLLSSARSYGFESRNPRWKRDLDDGQRNVLEDVVRDGLEVYGYL